VFGHDGDAAALERLDLVEVLVALEVEEVFRLADPLAHTLQDAHAVFLVYCLLRLLQELKHHLTHCVQI